VHDQLLAPLVHVAFERGFGIEEGLMTTIHAYTATQKRWMDRAKRIGKAAGSAAINIIPSTPGGQSGRAGLSEVKGKLTGMAFRVPTPTVSCVDLTVRTTRDTKLCGNFGGDEEGGQSYLKGILETTNDEVVSTDFIHSRSSSIFDEGSGIELNKRFFKLVSWYDNEWGYSNRVADLLKYMIQKGGF